MPIDAGPSKNFMALMKEHKRRNKRVAHHMAQDKNKKLPKTKQYDNPPVRITGVRG